MKRLTMFLLIAAISAVMFVFAGCESASAAPAVGSEKIGHVLLSNEQTYEIQEVTTFAAHEQGLLSNETAYRARSAPTRSGPFQYQDTQMSHAPPYESYFARVKTRPKLCDYKGIGHNHFARADV